MKENSANRDTAPHSANGRCWAQHGTTQTTNQTDKQSRIEGAGKKADQFKNNGIDNRSNLQRIVSADGHLMDNNLKGCTVPPQGFTRIL